jgi:hypothetical protein
MKTNKELDEFLCKSYPKMFVNRNGDMKQTCMVWGFETGAGWGNILMSLCAGIQWHIDQARKSRATALRYNRALKKALDGDTSALIKHYTHGAAGSEYTMKYVNADIARGEKAFRPVEPKIQQVVVSQVKEKFGTLRFYYSGGDAHIDGLVSMAEAMSACTCEECGAPGRRSTGGWISVRCATHGGTPEDETEPYEP